MACCIRCNGNGAYQVAIIAIRYLVGSVGCKAAECYGTFRTITGGWIGTAQQVGRSSFRRCILITKSHEYDYKTGYEGFHFSKVSVSTYATRSTAYERDIVREIAHCTKDSSGITGDSSKRNVCWTYVVSLKS
jgi:hypothetical protein